MAVSTAGLTARGSLLGAADAGAVSDGGWWRCGGRGFLLRRRAHHLLATAPQYLAVLVSVFGVLFYENPFGVTCPITVSLGIHGCESGRLAIVNLAV
jgi:hypothetical protein